MVTSRSAPGRAGDQALQRLAIVGGDAEVDRLAAASLQEGDERQAVGADDLAGPYADRPA